MEHQSQSRQPNISRDAKTLIKDLMSSTHIVRDYGDSYPEEQENVSYTSDFGGYAALFAALNINILSVSYEPAPNPRRVYTTDVSQDISSQDLARRLIKERPGSDPAGSDQTAEQLWLDSGSQRVTFLIEFKVRTIDSNYSTQLKWVKFPVTVLQEDLGDTPDYVYGQIIDQVLQARTMLQTPSIWSSLTRFERGE